MFVSLQYIITTINNAVLISNNNIFKYSDYLQIPNFVIIKRHFKSSPASRVNQRTMLCRREYVRCRHARYLLTRVMMYLSSIGIIFFLIDIQEASQAEVSDLDMVGRFHQDIAGCQIPVDQPPLLQIHHPLQHTHTFGYNAQARTCSYGINT